MTGSLKYSRSTWGTIAQPVNTPAPKLAPNKAIFNNRCDFFQGIGIFMGKTYREIFRSAPSPKNYPYTNVYSFTREYQAIARNLPIVMKDARQDGSGAMGVNIRLERILGGLIIIESDVIPSSCGRFEEKG